MTMTTTHVFSEGGGSRDSDPLMPHHRGHLRWLHEPRGCVVGPCSEEIFSPGIKDLVVPNIHTEHRRQDGRAVEHPGNKKMISDGDTGFPSQSFGLK